MKKRVWSLLLGSLFLLMGSSSWALELSSRRVVVDKGLNTVEALKIVHQILNFEAESHEPIYLLVTGSGGSLEGVSMVYNTMTSIQSPVVSIVMAPLFGANAAFPLLADRMVMLRSSKLVLTEPQLENIKKPLPQKAGEEDKAAQESEDKEAAFLEQVRQESVNDFLALVAKRLNEPKATFLKTLENEGGAVYSPERALAKKAAYEILSELKVATPKKEKTELKVMTVRQKTHLTD